MKKINLPVNWNDGMKINKNHFIETDNYISQQVKSIYSAFTNPLNYGILLQQEGNINPLNIYIDIDNQGYVHVKVLNCNAITSSGDKIEIHDNHFSDNDLSKAIPEFKINPEDISKKEYYIALSVNSFDRIPFGVPDPEENPPRLPYVLPGYYLSVHSVDEKNTIQSEHSLIIGKLIFNETKPEIDDNYIPPCQAIYSHPKLVEYHSQLIKIMGQIEIDIVEILHGIKDRKQSANIAASIADVANSVLNFIDVHMVELRKIARYHPPVFIFEQMAALARTINNAINKQSSADREELLNYIIDWSSLKQGEFEDLLNNTIEYRYDHNDINESINSLTPFVNSMSKIFNTLSNLDFIGKKKDRHIFVKEQKEKPGSSFLVD
ncbi:MAG: hypothetical protein HQ522_23215 [Bacteroidetes bacterium]|nr:hypothetical protein [Bacteroidota bacterium]